MQVRSTSDVELQLLETVAEELGDLSFSVDSRQIMLRSAAPPSWVTFIAEADWWVKTLGLYAGIYVAEIAKEAGKTTWQNRSKVVSSGVSAINAVKRFGASLGGLRKRLSPGTRLEIAVPVPDDYFCTRIELVGIDGEHLALQMALFVSHLPALTEFMESQVLNRKTVAGGISLTLLEDGSLHLRWQDNTVLNEHTATIPLALP